MRRMLLGLGLFLPWLAMATPQVVVESQVTPDSAIRVGQTLTLQVDVLVDTWFTAAPVLPALELAGAVVREPDSATQHLTLTRNGTTLFGVRYEYRITPLKAQGFVIPSLAVQVQAGQASGLQVVHSKPLRFIADAPTTSETLLVASAIDLQQHVERSRSQLQVGDSVSRRITLRAEGTQAILLEAVPLLEVEGLRRRPLAPEISDVPAPEGRGTVRGGQRIDSARYVIERAGRFQLPPIAVQWWDSVEHRQRTARLPALTFEAVAGQGSSGPFAVDTALSADAYGRAPWVARLAVALLAMLLTGSLVLCVLNLYGKRLRSALQAHWLALHAAWRHSAGQAWRRVPAQLRASPMRLDALYLWARRAFSGRTARLLDLPLSGALRAQLKQAMQAAYGRHSDRTATLGWLRAALPELRRQARRQSRRPMTQALKALNPERPTERPRRKDHPYVR